MCRRFPRRHRLYWNAFSPKFQIRLEWACWWTGFSTATAHLHHRRRPVSWARATVNFRCHRPQKLHLADGGQHARCLEAWCLCLEVDPLATSAAHWPPKWALCNAFLGQLAAQLSVSLLWRFKSERVSHAWLSLMAGTWIESCSRFYWRTHQVALHSS